MVRKHHAKFRITEVNGAGATNTLLTGDGMLINVSINEITTAGTITIYDATSATGDPMATIDDTSIAQGQQYQLIGEFDTGLTVVHTGDMDFSVSFKG